MKYFPVFVDLNEKSVLVVGAGSVARRKISLLLKTGARITVIAKDACDEVVQWHHAGKLRYWRGAFSPCDLDGQWLVIAATNNREVNSTIQLAATARQLLVNVVDDRELSQFIVPSIVDRDPVQIAISTGGDAPVLARTLRADLETRLPASLGKLAQKMGKWRAAVRHKLPLAGQRRLFWEKLLDSSVPDHVYRGRDSEADAELMRLINSDTNAPEKGHVSLVGGGPGDPELLTIKALQRLQTADVVFYDNLVSEAVLELVRRDADLVYVGKKSGAQSCKQTDIQQQLVHAAAGGKRVVRLKGGDPFVFGRGGEELEALVQAGISFDVVPGITAAAASAAYTGIPLTHRDYAHSAILVTGHGKADTDLDWQALAKSEQTLAVYMGLKQSSTIMEQLIAHGRAPDTPVVIVERATTPDQRYVSGILQELPQLVEQHGIESPAMILIGEVCRLAGRYHWFNVQPDASGSTAPVQLMNRSAVI